MSRSVHAFDRQDDLVEALSQSISKQLQRAIEKKGKASLLVSGGSTPKPLFEKLRHAAIEWDRVSVGLCDERLVSSSHEDSNERFVKTHLLQDNASKAKFIGMYKDGMSLQEAEKSCSQKLKEELFPFDVIVLGMGKDAHTASLFPENPKLEKAFDLNNKEFCIAVEPKSAPHARLSLTRSAILSASHIYLHFEGKEKGAVYQEVIEGEDMYKMPIRSVLNQDIKEVEVYFT
mgnify:CR=1 FL=1